MYANSLPIPNTSLTTFEIFSRDYIVCVNSRCDSNTRECGDCVRIVESEFAFGELFSHYKGYETV